MVAVVVMAVAMVEAVVMVVVVAAAMVMSAAALTGMYRQQGAGRPAATAVTVWRAGGWGMCVISQVIIRASRRSTGLCLDKGGAEIRSQVGELSRP